MGTVKGPVNEEKMVEKPLTELQERFVHEFLKIGRAGAAAQAAGYARNSAHISAYRLLQDPRVAARLEELRRTVLSPDMVTREALLGSMVRDYMELTSAQQRIKAAESIARVAGISGVTNVEVGADRRSVTFILPDGKEVMKLDKIND